MKNVKKNEKAEKQNGKTKKTKTEKAENAQHGSAAQRSEAPGGSFSLCFKGAAALAPSNQNLLTGFDVSFPLFYIFHPGTLHFRPKRHVLTDPRFDGF